MSEVKSLNVTDTTYRHRGWMWRDRATYELFKPYMKLPSWVDRILTGSRGASVYVVGTSDGTGNAIRVGSMARGPLDIPDTFLAYDAMYNCNTNVGNGFVVLAERIRAKKPDANKTPRPQWRQPMDKPWEPGTLGGNWVVDSKLVKEVRLATPPPPAWADRLWVSTSGGTDTFVWVNSAAWATTSAGARHTAKHAAGIRGHQILGEYDGNHVVTNRGCHWQLAGVRKKTVQLPAAKIAKAAPITVTPVTTGRVSAANVVKDELSYYGTDTGRVPALNPALAAPYGTGIYSSIAQELRTARNKAKVRSFRSMFNPPLSILNLDLSAIEATAAYLYGSLESKPPIGVKPRNLHDEERANALDEAMVRHLNEDLPFPTEWAVEWNELRTRLNKEQK